VGKFSQDELPEVAEKIAIEMPAQPTPDAVTSFPARTKADTAQSNPDQRILAALGETPMHLDEIAEQTGLDPGVLNSRLLMMELSGSIVSYPGNRYTRTS